MESSQLCLSWKDHSTALSTVCKTLLENDFLVDCTIAADGQRLKAHRLILSACSPYFQMLFGEETEKHPIVFLKDVSFDTLKAIVDFIYHGETEISEGHLDAFLALATSLQIKGLNDSSKKDTKPFSSDAAGNVAHSSSNDSKDVNEVPSASASHEDSHNNFTVQHDTYHSDVLPDVASSNSVPFEGCSDTEEMEVKASVIQPSHQQTPTLQNESTFETERNERPEPLHEVLLVPKQEQVDVVENDELLQDMPEEDSNTMEGIAPAFGEQLLSRFSGIGASSSESSSVLPGAFSVPQMLVPPDAQGAEMATHAARRDGLPGRPRLQQRKRRCPYCYKSFLTPSLLQRHVHIHTGERPFSCGECGAAFVQPGHLKQHERTHTGERPYRCDLCDAAFTQSNTLIRHKRSHMGDR